MAVAFDAVGPAGGAGVNDATIPNATWAHINSAAGNAIVVDVGWFATGSSDVTAVDYGGVALSRLIQRASGGSTAGGIDYWGKVGGLPTGSNTVTVTFSRAESHNLGSRSYTGARGFGTPVAIDSAGVSVGSIASPSITTAAGGIVAAAACKGQAVGATWSVTSGTIRWSLNTSGLSASDNVGAGDKPSPGGSTTITIGSTAPNDFMAIVAVEILPTLSADIRPQPGGENWRRLHHRVQGQRFPSAASVPDLQVTAGLASATGAALDVDPDSALAPPQAAGTGSAGTPGIGLGAGLPGGSGAASAPGIGLAPGLPAGSGAAGQVGTILGAGLSQGAGSAQQPGVMLAPGVASGAGSAQSASPSSAVTSGLATGAGAARAPGIGLTPALASGVGAAGSLGIGLGGGLAQGAGSAQTLGVGLTPALASGSGTAQSAAPINTVITIVATGLGVAFDAVAAGGGSNLNVTAGLASGTGAAQSPIPSATATGGLASGTGAAQAPGIRLGAGLASGSGASLAPGIMLGVPVAGGTGTAQPCGQLRGVTLPTGAGAALTAASVATAAASVATGSGASRAPGIGLAPLLATATGTAEDPGLAATVTALLASGVGVSWAALAATIATQISLRSVTAGEPHGRWAAGPPHGRFEAAAPHGRWGDGPPHGRYSSGEPHGRWGARPPHG